MGTFADVGAVGFLSSAMKLEIRCEMFKSHLDCHPFFRLVAQVDLASIQNVCVECVEFKHLINEDDLFSPGSDATEAFLLISGFLNYAQDPESSVVEERTSCDVHPGVWICEAALWVHWSHVGKLEAVTASQLLVIDAERLVVLLQKHRFVRMVMHAYARAFHSRLMASAPPQQKWPTDIGVEPGLVAEDYGEIVVSMPQDVQIFISKITLAMLQGRSFGSQQRLELLEDELNNGKCALIQNGASGEVERLAVIVVLRLKQRDGRIFVRLGGWRGSKLEVSCALPVAEQRQNESPDATIQRILRSDFHFLQGDAEFQCTRHDWESSMSGTYHMRTRYFRNIICARFTGVYGLESQGVRMERSGLPDHEVHVLGDEGEASLYTWLPQFEMEGLAGQDGLQRLHNWVAAVQEHFCGHHLKKAEASIQLAGLFRRGRSADSASRSRVSFKIW